MSKTRTPPPDHEIHLKQKNHMKGRVIGSLVTVALLYFFLLFPQELLDRLSLLVTVRGEAWTDIVGAGGNLSLTLVLSFLLFASDSAFRGSGKTATWARSIFASRAAMERYQCSTSEASTLWFKYFDTWGIDGSPNRNLLINSYAATYAARAIFYLERALVLFLALGGVSMLIHWLALGSYRGEGSDIRLMIHVLAISFLAAWLWFLLATNRIPSGDKPATGCWAKVEDVFGRSKTVFTHEVLIKAATLDDALEFVRRLRDDLLAA